MNLWQKIKLVFTDKYLRRKIIFVLLILAVFRILSTIPIPGIDTFRLEGFLSDNQFLGILNIFSGGGLSALSIVMMGVGPYITGSIIMQLLTLMSPRLKSMYHEEGEMGRTQFAKYSRYITVPLALIQSYALLTILAQNGALEALTLYQKALAMIVATAGSMFLVWLGDLISERGIGNGVSVIIFAGIVASIPGHIIMSEFATTGDGLMAALQVLSIMKMEGKPLSALTHCFEPLPQMLQNVRAPARVLEAEAVRALLREIETNAEVRFVVRPSGTEPLIRVGAGD
jgi:preprotein translocase subunit SecY